MLELTRLMQLVSTLHQFSKADNLQQVCGVSGCVRHDHSVNSVCRVGRVGNVGSVCRVVTVGLECRVRFVDYIRKIICAW